MEGVRKCRGRVNFWGMTGFVHPQDFKKATLGQEALLREREEAILMERKRRYGARASPQTSSLSWSHKLGYLGSATHDIQPFVWSGRPPVTACVISVKDLEQGPGSAGELACEYPGR